jgi:SNF2 family DNA or RNA helicase
MSNLRHIETTNLTAKLTAFPYQHEAFLAIKDKPYAAIFHEQGLGKTKIAIDLLLYWLDKRDIDTVMIVTKKTLVANWVGEFDTHTNLRPKVLDTKKKSNYFVLNSAARVIITNFETISTEQDRLQLFLKTRNVAIIIDESTKIKNPESKLTQDFFAISALFKIKVIMTGTPVANRPYDIWAQIYFLDEGHSLGTNFAEFKAMCDLSNDLQEDESKRIIFEDSVAGIYNKIKDFSVRETKNSGIITLPSKIYHDVTVGFEQKQFEMYETLRKDMELTLTRGDETILDESTETIKRLLRLVQITSNPKLIDESYVGESAKEILLDQLIERIISQDEMVIVWSIYTGNIDMFCKKYAKYGAVKITGKMAVEERNKSVAAFKSGKAKLLFATPQSAKEGLTLTIANNAIFYDRGFNLDDYLQAQDRIHRISQKRDCHIYNLMVEDSIDIWIDYLLKAKQRAAFLAQGDINLKDYKDEADYSFANIVHEILNTN